RTGLALERQGLYAEAIAAFRKAVASAPDFAEAQAKIGNLLLNHGDEAQALDCLRRAAAVDPESSIGLLCEAKLLMEEGKAAAAEERLRRAIDRDPLNSDTHSLLGTVLMELGRFDDAAVSADLSVALNRWQSGGYYQLAAVKRLREADRPLIDQMEWMLEEYGFAKG